MEKTLRIISFWLYGSVAPSLIESKSGTQKSAHVSRCERRFSCRNCRSTRAPASCASSPPRCSPAPRSRRRFFSPRRRKRGKNHQSNRRHPHHATGKTGENGIALVGGATVSGGITNTGTIIGSTAAIDVSGEGGPEPRSRNRPARSSEASSVRGTRMPTCSISPAGASCFRRRKVSRASAPTTRRAARSCCR